MSGILSNASVGKILDNRQKKRLLDLNNADPNSQHIIFQSSAGRDGWYVQMNEAGLKERQKFLTAAAVRVGGKGRVSYQRQQRRCGASGE